MLDRSALETALEADSAQEASALSQTAALAAADLDQEMTVLNQTVARVMVDLDQEMIALSRTAALVMADLAQGMTVLNQSAAHVVADSAQEVTAPNQTEVLAAADSAHEAIGTMQAAAAGLAVARASATVDARLQERSQKAREPLESISKRPLDMKRRRPENPLVVGALVSVRSFKMQGSLLPSYDWIAGGRNT